MNPGGLFCTGTTDGRVAQLLEKQVAVTGAAGHASPEKANRVGAFPAAPGVRRSPQGVT